MTWPGLYLLMARRLVLGKIVAMPFLIHARKAAWNCVQATVGLYLLRNKRGFLPWDIKHPVFHGFNAPCEAFIAHLHADARVLI